MADERQANNGMRGLLIGLSVSALILISFFAGGLADRVFVIKPLDYLVHRSGGGMGTVSDLQSTNLSALVQSGQNFTVADVAEATSKSVVTVSIKTQQPVQQQGLPGFFGFDMPGSGQTKEVQQDIGSGFVVDQSGLIVTNKHVVSDMNAEYKVIDKDNKEYKVQRIYRDPSTDLAILKIDGAQLSPLGLGDSDKLRVGEPVIAIGTALGEFRHTVTTGVISGLGRGITAGTGYGFGASEELSNVIQTDAAINPGNSGGPLLNSRGEVVGVNVAVTANAQNIGFALPINVIKDSLQNFNSTGQFDRPFFGVRYQLISQQAALANEVPQGAYVLEVIKGSTAEEAGLKQGDIITKVDGTALKNDQNLAQIINKKKVGDKMDVTYWRDKQDHTVNVTLKVAPNQ